MIEIPGDKGTNPSPTGNGRPRHDEGTNLLAWLKENKVLAGIVLVVVLVLGGFMVFGQGGDQDPSGRNGTAVDSGEVDYGQQQPTTPATPAAAASPTAGTGQDSTDPDAPAGSGDAPSPAPASPSFPSMSGEPSLAPGVDPGLAMDPNAQYEMAPEMQDPEPVAESFAVGWMNPEGGKKAWLKRLEPNVTSFALENLSYTAEEAIYDQEVTNVILKPLEAGEYESAFRVFGEDDEAVMDGTMIMMPDGSWKVDRIMEANTLILD